MRVNTSRTWSTGNGSPDAICFLVDRPGVALVGVCVYVGAGQYEYNIELLYDVRSSILKLNFYCTILSVSKEEFYHQ